MVLRYTYHGPLITTTFKKSKKNNVKNRRSIDDEEEVVVVKSGAHTKLTPNTKEKDKTIGGGGGLNDPWNEKRSHKLFFSVAAIAIAI